MTVDQKKIIDFIGTEKTTGDVVLTISDHLDWVDVSSHLYTLQEKINDYLAFIESGEIFDEYPKARGKKIKIKIYFRYAPPAGDALSFISHAEEIISNAGFALITKFNETKT